LTLGTGNYTYDIRCVDNGGNMVQTNISFGIEVDKSVPIITRVYKDSSNTLKIVTNENAKCYYSLTSCNFDITDGIAFGYSSLNNERNHVTAFKDKISYYIKCEDMYENKPEPNSCSMIVSGVDLSVQAVV
jgi:hypothetical protein